MSQTAYTTKGFSKKIRSSVHSTRLAQKLSIALHELQELDVQQIDRSPKVHKVHTTNKIDLYFYRVDRSRRILFSIVENAIVVCDIIDISRKADVRSLLLKSQQID